MVGVSPHLGVARVEMGVHVHHRQRAVLLRDGAEGGKGDRVVTPQGERDGSDAEDAGDLVLDGLARQGR